MPALPDRTRYGQLDESGPYRAFFEFSTDAMFIGNPDGSVIDVNAAWLDLFGYTRDELPGFNIADAYVNPEDRKRFLRSMSERGVAQDEIRFRRKDGTEFDCERTSIALRDDRGDLTVFQGIMRDVTWRKEHERALHDSQDRYRALFENTMDAVALVSPGGLLLEANPAYLALFGYTHEDIGTLNVEEQYVNEEERTAFLEWMATHDSVVDEEVHLKKRDGTVMNCLRNVFVRRDDGGNIIGEQSVIRDVTQQKRAYDELECLARYDTLTGLLNRRAVLERLEEWLRHVERYGGAFCVIMLDLDHFKRVNDDYGHQVGDHVLAQTAEVLRQGLRQTDIVGRYGGEEFLVVLPHSDCSGARVVAERIRKHMERTVMADGKAKTFSITVSLGIGERFRGDGVDTLVGRADKALYLAKANGRNRVETMKAPQ